jgi:hypothetical protein
MSVGGAGDAQGSIRLNWACDGVRLRDHLANKVQVEALTYISANDSNKTATREPGEPNPVLMDYQKTNWYSFKVTTESLALPDVDNRPIRIRVLETEDSTYPVDSLSGDGVTTTIVQNQKPRYNPLIAVYTEDLTLYALGNDPSLYADAPFSLTYTDSTTGGREKVAGTAREAALTFVGFVGQTYLVQIDGLPTCLPNDPSSGRYQLKFEQLQPE